jgi:site-specific DNA recombinase
MKNAKGKNGDGRDLQPAIRCAIYTRKSTDENLDSDFNSLDAQREACELYIQAQSREGWIALPERYDDGAYSGATMERPAAQRLLRDIEAGRIDVVVVYKIDRLSRSLADFTRLMELFKQHNVAMVSVTQAFNTNTSSGVLFMNLLMTFASYEREVIAERIRDKVAASKRRGMYMGGTPPLGYDVDREKKKLVVNDEEAVLVRRIFQRYLVLCSATALMRELNAEGLTTKSWTTKKGVKRKGVPWNKSHIHRLLNNPIYVGQIKHKDKVYPGEQRAIIEKSLWDEVQKTMKSEGRSGAFRSSTPALLKGLIRCGHCGTSMGITFAQKNGKRYRYYLCLHANKSGYNACPVKTVPAGDVENAVLIQVRRGLQTPDVVAKTGHRAMKMEGDIFASLKQRLADLDAETGPLRDAAERTRRGGNGRVGFYEAPAEIEEKVKALEAERQRIVAELAWREDHPVTESELIAELARFDAIWDELFPAERARIVRLLVESVTVSETGIDLELRADGIGELLAEMHNEAQSMSH